MADQAFVLAPPTVTVGFALEPVQNLINSLSLLNQVETRSGLGEWVERTITTLSEERRLKNAIVLEVMWSVCLSEIAAPDFPSYRAALAAKTPAQMRAEAVEMLSKKMNFSDPEALLADKSLYMETIEKTIGAHWAEKGEVFPLATFEAAFAWFQDPALMKAEILEHLDYMWLHHLEPEWKRVLPMLQESIDAFSQVDFSGQTALQAARVVTGRNLQGVWEELDHAERVIFVPSAHIGPYVSMYTRSDDLYVVYRARVPEGAKTRSPALSRSELLVRLNALADETRLVILELLTEREELCAQDIITLLNLSQSSASRHLRQLTATGYLVERRRDVAKCYSLNPDRITDTIVALKYFLRGR